MHTSSSWDPSRRTVLVLVMPRSPDPQTRVQRDDGRRGAFLASVERSLADAIGVRPTAISLSKGPDGAPVLVGAPWLVSVSHAAGVSVVALADGAVGVDVESDALPPTSARRLAARFTPAQQASAARPDGGVDPDVVRTLWVRKEAVLKAAGQGLAAGVGRLTVPLEPPPVAAWSDGHLGRWYVQDVPGVDGALAVATRREVGVEVVTTALGG